MISPCQANDRSAQSTLISVTSGAVLSIQKAVKREEQAGQRGRVESQQAKGRNGSEG